MSNYEKEYRCLGFHALQMAFSNTKIASIHGQHLKKAVVKRCILGGCCDDQFFQNAELIGAVKWHGGYLKEIVVQNDSSCWKQRCKLSFGDWAPVRHCMLLDKPSHSVDGLYPLGSCAWCNPRAQQKKLHQASPRAMELY